MFKNKIGYVLPIMVLNLRNKAKHECCIYFYNKNIDLSFFGSLRKEIYLMIINLILNPAFNRGLRLFPSRSKYLKMNIVLLRFGSYRLGILFLIVQMILINFDFIDGMNRVIKQYYF